MATADQRDIMMIAGEDPHAWKGTVETHQAFVRSTGDGGCIDSKTKLPANDAQPSAQISEQPSASSV